MHSYESVALRGGRRCAERVQLWRLKYPFGLILYGFPKGLRFIISMAEGRSFGAAAGTAQVLHFPKK